MEHGPLECKQGEILRCRVGDPPALSFSWPDTDSRIELAVDRSKLIARVLLVDRDAAFGIGNPFRDSAGLSCGSQERGSEAISSPGSLTEVVTSISPQGCRGACAHSESGVNRLSSMIHLGKHKRTEFVTIILLMGMSLSRARSGVSRTWSAHSVPVPGRRWMAGVREAAFPVMMPDDVVWWGWRTKCRCIRCFPSNPGRSVRTSGIRHPGGSRAS